MRDGTVIVDTTLDVPMEVRHSMMNMDLYSIMQIAVSIFAKNVL